MENEKYGWRGSTDLKQAAMMNIIPGTSWEWLKRLLALSS
jgi:hypothetical protein